MKYLWLVKNKSKLVLNITLHAYCLIDPYKVD